MNKKYLTFIFIKAIIVFYMYSQSYDLFKYNKLSGIDYYTGNELSFFSNKDVLNDIVLVKSIKIDIKSENTVNTLLYMYTDGMIQSIYSNIRDGRESLFAYTNKGYLENFDFQKRKYPLDNVCILEEDGKIKFRITVEDNGNYKKIIFERPQYDSDNYFISQVFEYLYVDNKIISYNESYLNTKGEIYSKHFHEFEYSEDSLISHTIKVNDKLRWSYNLLYDRDNKLNEILYKDFKNSTNNRRKIFECYDEHNNWVKSKEYYENDLVYEITRTIDYVK